jgi:hypothetical protein
MMNKHMILKRDLKLESVQGRSLLPLVLIILMSFSVNLCAEQTGAGQDAADDIPAVLSEKEATEDEMVAADDLPALVSEEVNTNDPTAAAISLSAGWEFTDWYEDEIAPGQTRPTGNANTFNTRMVYPMAKGTLGSPWPIINRFSFSNVEAPGGTSGSGNAEFISLFIPWTWGTGKIGLGPAINLPADEKQFGTDVWRFGFAGVVLENSLEGRLMWGVLLRQVWGKTDPNSNKSLASPFAFQPIVIYQLNDGWYLGNGESPIAYNWQKNEILVPLGIRLGRAIKLKSGGTLNMYGEYRTNIIYKNWSGAAGKNIIRISASYTFGG